jgi:hypothetical protein
VAGSRMVSWPTGAWAWRGQPVRLSMCEAGWLATFKELVDEALRAPFSGWNFSWLAAWSRSGRLLWSYRREVARRAAAASAMLDMGTGGGERLSPPPPQTVATEAWPPSVPVAAARLRPLGIAVVQDEGTADNIPQEERQPRPATCAWSAGPSRSSAWTPALQPCGQRTAPPAYGPFRSGSSPRSNCYKTTTVLMPTPHANAGWP